VREIKTTSFSITLDNGHVEKPKFESFYGRGFRVLKNGSWGYFSGIIGAKDAEKDMKKDITMGIERAERNIVKKGSVKIDTSSESGKHIFKPKVNPKDVSVDEKVKFLRDLEKEVKDSHIVSTRLTYIEVMRVFRYVNSNGSEIYYEVPRTGIMVQAVAKDEFLQFLSKSIFKPGGFEVLSGDRPYNIAEEVKNKLKELLRAHPPPSGKMPVLMDSSLGGVFIHEAFGHAVEADHLTKGASVLKETGIRVGPEDLYVYDDPLLEEFGFFPFDDEGIRARKKTIIEAGIFKEFLHSRETACKLGGEPGNSRCQGVSEPIIRMSNTYIAEGSYSFEELLEEVRNGVYLVGTRGGETNPATGYFQFSAQYGYLVINGEVKEMIRDVSLSGHTLEILKNIKVGKGLSFDPGFCEKLGQLVPVADGAPPTVVEAFVGGV